MILEGIWRIIEATEDRILMEEDMGGPVGGKIIRITPQQDQFMGSLLIEELRPKEIK